LKIERRWAMPNGATFLIPPIERLLLEEGVQSGLWADAFAGNNSPAYLKNDLDPGVQVDSHMDARKWLRGLPAASCDGVLLDPPYSISQAAELYRGVGADRLADGPHNMAYWADIKDEIARIVKPRGKAICFGWSSMGLGRERGFVMQRVLLVPHGGSKNDTIVTVETKCQMRFGDMEGADATL